jgi:hypothetical protein
MDKVHCKARGTMLQKLCSCKMFALILDWVTVKTQLLYCSISYVFIAFVGFIAFIAVLNNNESDETNERYK